MPGIISARAAVIESGFGILWFGWGQEAPWLVPVLVVGPVTGLCLLAHSAWLLVAMRRGDAAPA